MSLKPEISNGRGDFVIIPEPDEISRFWIQCLGGGGKTSLAPKPPLIRERSLANPIGRMVSGKDKEVLTEKNASMIERFRNLFPRKNVEIDCIGARYVIPN